MQTSTLLSLLKPWYGTNKQQRHAIPIEADRIFHLTQVLPTR